MADSTPQFLDLPDSDVAFFPAFFSGSDADRLLQELGETTAWRQESIKLYGKPVDIPRLTAWYGDAGAGYTYSGIANVPLPWTPTLLEVKRAVEEPSGVVFNSVLLNRYRTGKDSVSWHSDDEKEFGENPVIASVSFGDTRTFQFRHKKRKQLKASVELTHGSLLIMRGATQHNWLHQIPKTSRDVGERINLTFRVVRAVSG
jgi:alkylated DNA repair dioxygenase AlkB